MDIDLLSKMVKELILDNDRVTLPGLGTFVAEIVPSTFSDKGYTINPPYRRLYFRSRPDEGDVLTDFYAKTNNIARDVADKIIRDFLTELKTLLYTRKTVVFPGLGRLRATKENALFFVADEELDIYPEGFGLEPISLKTHQETEAEVVKAVVELKEMVSVGTEESLEELTESTVEVSESVEPEPVVPVEPEPTVGTVQMESMIEPEPTVEPAPIVDAEPAKRAWRMVGRIVLWTLAAVAVFLFAFTVASRAFPQLFDDLLYTTEELEIINK